MRPVTISEAQTQFLELLVQVQAGEHVTITDHGVPVARLLPVASTAAALEPSAHRLAVDAAFGALAKLSEGVRLDVPLREAIEGGRR